MASCAECNIKMGYTESNVARDHEGMFDMKGSMK